jgi:cytochrome P450
VDTPVSTDTGETNAIVTELMSEAGRADPYPLYRKLHAVGPASTASEGFVVANGYAEINAVLRNPAFGKWDAAVAPGTEAAEHASLSTLNKGILDINPPDHTRVRRLMSTVFTPRRTAGLAPAIARTTEALLDSMAKAGAGGRAVDSWRSSRSGCRSR